MIETQAKELKKLWGNKRQFLFQVKCESHGGRRSRRGLHAVWSSQRCDTARTGRPRRRVDVRWTMLDSCNTTPRSTNLYPISPPRPSTLLSS